MFVREPLLRDGDVHGSDVCVEDVRLTQNHGWRRRSEGAECSGVALLAALVQLDRSHLSATEALAPVRVLQPK